MVRGSGDEMFSTYSQTLNGLAYDISLFIEFHTLNDWTLVGPAG